MIRHKTSILDHHLFIIQFLSHNTYNTYSKHFLYLGPIQDLYDHFLVK